MNILKTGLCLVLLGAGVVSVSGLQSAAAGQPNAAPDKSLVQQMRGEASSAVRVTPERATGKVSFIRADANGDLLPSVSGDSAAAATAKASAYLKDYAEAFGASRSDLAQAEVTSNSYGRTVTYEQKHDGVAVFGGLVRAHLDTAGDLTAVNGELVPVGSVDTTPALSEAEAGARAIKQVQASPPTSADGTSDLTGIEAKNAELLVYKRGLVQGLAGGAVELVYQVEVTNGRNVRDMVFLNADSGKVVNRYSMIHDALDRELYQGSPAPEDLVWEEGDDFPGSLDEDQQRLVVGTGESYWFFKNGFDRDSYDGNGATMRTVNDDPTIACPNANWNGNTTNYCTDVTSDDTVAHEWGHAYTEYTHGLIYQWQSGALNESYSDIWGETVDMINGRQDEDGLGDVRRTVGLCSSFTRGPIAGTFNAPPSIAGPCDAAAPAAFGPVIDDEGVTSDVIVAVDAANPEGPDGHRRLLGVHQRQLSGGQLRLCRPRHLHLRREGRQRRGCRRDRHRRRRQRPRVAPPISMTGVADIYGVMVTRDDGTAIKGARRRSST